MINILLLGGSSEATALARVLADRGWPATFSYAGRVKALAPQPLPTRVGGFGGVDGLVRYLRDHQITHLIDATHPFAGQISTHAVRAAEQAGVPLLAFTRPPWTPEAGDHWQTVPDMAAAVAALSGPPERIMLALGRLQLPLFAAQPQHHYLLRFVEEPTELLPVPDYSLIIDRGPFTEESDRALLEQYRIDRVVSKNAGGEGARAKLTAARQLGLPVLMIDRPQVPPRAEVHSVEAVLDWLAHESERSPEAERGV
ncbi:cobalt-precorrin-6A reductase [Natronospirillum operosum]|uniref:Cobalt-precorrin-6A reductase n=2 Tax=Natronospirillum operosum TaxID=2759953 RepID=A0A4Z0WFD0_9GAMM|nr:cobalt-precorrin-6A reductase [Natronospirillum operosum]